MKKITKLTILAFIGPFAATFFICLFVLLMQFLWRYVDDLAGKGLEFSVILEFLVYASARLIPLALPLSVLLSSLMTFGNLAENYELIAFKSSGVSLVKIMRPLAFLVFLIATLAFLFANYNIPRANLKFANLLWDIKQKKPTMDIQDGIFFNGLDGFSIRVAHKDIETDRLYDIIIYDHTEKRGNVHVTRAEEGEMISTPDERFMILTLYNGERYLEMEEPKPNQRSFPHNRMKFKKYRIRFDLSSFGFQRTKEELFSNSARMMNMGQLNHYVDSMWGEYHEEVAATPEQTAPYLHYKSDSLFSKYAVTEEVAVPDGEYALIFKDKAYRGIISKAAGSARSMKSILNTADEDQRYFSYRATKGLIEWHRKLTLSLACLLMFFIGAPLGAIIRKGGLGLPVVISTVIFVLFYMVMITGERSTKEELIIPQIGMWYPNIALVPIGFFLTYKANRDSKIFKLESYLSRIKGLFKRKKK